MSIEVRTQLDPDETMAEEIRPFEKMFLCGVVGVLLRKRGPNDPHICFEIISEDDENWFPYSGGGSSSYWFDCYIAALTAAKKWCEEEALPHVGQYTHNPDIPCGWRFK